MSLLLGPLPRSRHQLPATNATRQSRGGARHKPTIPESERTSRSRGAGRKAEGLFATLGPPGRCTPEPTAKARG